MSDIFREIEDELRRDNLLRLWSRYGKYVIAAAIVALLAAGGLVVWRDHQAGERRAQGDQFSVALALAREGKESEASQAFARLSQNGSGYGVVAAFEQAELLARKGDQKGAIAAYDRLASSDAPAEFRDLALLLSVAHGLPDGDAAAAITRLAPLTVTGNPWRYTALDLTAAAKLKASDRAGALVIYKQLADDLAAPEGLRARATEMAAALKS